MLEEDEEEDGKAESGGSSSEEEEEAADQEKGAASEAARRKKEDELWASFLSDVGSKPKAPPSTQAQVRVPECLPFGKACIVSVLFAS